MNGLAIVDLKQPDLLDKLLSREPRENAFLEIQNILACTPVDAVTPEFIRERLDLYGVEPKEAAPRLLHVYAQAAAAYVYAGRITEEDARILARMRALLGLSDADVAGLHASLALPFFERAAAAAFADGAVSPEEYARLDCIRRCFAIPTEVAEQVLGRQATPRVRSAVDAALADGRISPEEDAELLRLARDLRVEAPFVRYRAAHLERYRMLWRVANGAVELLEPPVQLKPGEGCAAVLGAEHHHVVGPPASPRHSGFVAGSGRSGVRFQSGSVGLDIVSQERLRLADVGTLYFTSERLLFVGSSVAVQIALRSIASATFYAGGMVVASPSGSEEAFLFQADMDLLRAIFDGLMTLSRT